MVDDAKGNMFAPAEWESSEPAIKNTIKAGVLVYTTRRSTRRKSRRRKLENRRDF